MKKYLVVNISTSPFEAESLSGFLWECEPSGIEELENSLNLFFNSDDFTPEEKVKQTLDDLSGKGIINSYELNSQVFDDKNWNEEWEKSIKVIQVTDKIVIKPTFRDYTPLTGQIVITIDPKMSFGTGEHQTTRLVISLLEKYALNREKVLDVGSGTAVLAITALKLGAKKGIAIDSDEWCYDNGIENAILNSVEHQLEIIIGETTDIHGNDFDLVLANIQKNVLIPIAKDLSIRTKKDGYLILSGLLANDEPDIRNKYEQLNFSFVEKKQMDEWIALVFLKV